jgi:hypothetical protein
MHINFNTCLVSFYISSYVLLGVFIPFLSRYLFLNTFSGIQEEEQECV